jgi:hypothetical protein
VPAAELIRLGRYPLEVVDEVGYIPFKSGGLRWCVHSMCAGLVELGVQIAPSAFYEHVDR